MMKYLIGFLMIASGCLPGLAFAGGEGSGAHGGDGVLIGGSLYLVDLVEGGIGTSPYYDPAIPPVRGLADRLREGLQNLDNAPIDLVARKISEIGQKVSPFLALTLVRVIEEYHWMLVDRDLRDVQDEDFTQTFRRSQLRQLAIRYNDGIEVARRPWSRLNPDHKGALILHEALYALASTISNTPDPSYRTRTLVRLLYSDVPATQVRDSLLRYRFDQVGGGAPIPFERPFAALIGRQITSSVSVALNAGVDFRWRFNESSNASDDFRAWLRAWCDRYWVNYGGHREYRSASLTFAMGAPFQVAVRDQGTESGFEVSVQLVDSEQPYETYSDIFTPAETAQLRTLPYEQCADGAIAAIPGHWNTRAISMRLQ